MTSKRESEVVSKPIIWQLEFQRKWILDGILHLIFLRKFAQRIVDKLIQLKHTQIYRAPQNLALFNMHLFYHIIFKEICDVVPSVTLIKFYDIFQHFNTQCFVSECVRL